MTDIDILCLAQTIFLIGKLGAELYSCISCHMERLT